MPRTIRCRMVPPFVTARTFCASRDGLRKLGFLKDGAYKTKIFCAVYDYAGKAYLNKGFWNLKRKLGVTKHFLEIIKLKFGNKFPYIVLFFKAFLNHGCILFSEKMRDYPNFSFCIPITLAKICFFPIIMTCAKIPLY